MSLSRKSTAAAVALSLLTFSLPPMAAMAQGGPQLMLQPTGNVQVWNDGQRTWDAFTGGAAYRNETLRCIEGGTLHGTIENEGASVVTLDLSSCSAIRFIRLQLSGHGNDIYAKAFGQVAWNLSPDRRGTDDIKTEFPVGLETLGRDGGAGSGPVKTTFQTPTAREVRLGIDNGSNARLQGVSFVTGTVVSINPGSNTFELKEDVSGRVDTISLKYWSQLAKPTLGQRVLNESPAQILGELTVGEHLTIYGVATAGASGSLPISAGAAAFAQATPINFLATVVFPNGGQYIFGGVFVLSSPITPAVGEGLTGAGLATLQLLVGQLQAALLPGLQLISVSCEIGDEVFVIPPPAAAGAIGSTPIFIGLGVAAALLLIHGNSSSNPPPNFIFHNASNP